MRSKLLLLLSVLAVLCLAVSGCGHSSGSSDIIGGTSSGGTGGGAGGLGSSNWSTAITDTPSGTAGPVVIPKFISSPAMAPDGTVYVGGTDHFLYALNPDGTVKWKFETGNNLYASPAVGSDGTVYIGSEDRQFYAINPDGTLKWIFPTKTVFTSSAALASDGTIYAAGTLLDKTIFLCPDGHTVSVQLGGLFAINPDGTQKWATETSGVTNSSPAVASDGTIYIGSRGDFIFDRTDYCNDKSIFPESDANPGLPSNGHLYAINPDGTKKWDFHTLGAVDSSPAIAADGTIYVGSERPLKFYGTDQNTLVDQSSSTTGFVYAINPDGTLKCFVDLFGDVDSSPAVGSDGTIYVGSDNFHVYALNPDCSIKWVEPTRDKVKSSPAIAADGTVYVGSNDSSLYAFDPDGTLKSTFDSTGAVNSSPAIGKDGTLYFVSAAGNGDSYDSNTVYAVPGTGSALASAPWPKFRHDLLNTGRQ
jgi:outer membrane protein assembly factor BamB